MLTAKKIYRRTKAGELALRSSDPGLADEDAAVLALIDGITHFDGIAACLPQWSKSTIQGLLEALESRSLVESVAVDWMRELYRLGRYEPTRPSRRTAPARSS